MPNGVTLRQCSKIPPAAGTKRRRWLPLARIGRGRRVELGRRRAIVGAVGDHRCCCGLTDGDAVVFGLTVRDCGERARTSCVEARRAGRKVVLQYAVRGGNGSGLRRRPWGRGDRAEVRIVVAGDRVDRFEHRRLSDRCEARLGERVLAADRVQHDYVPVQDDIGAGRSCPAQATADDQSDDAVECCPYHCCLLLLSFGCMVGFHRHLREHRGFARINPLPVRAITSFRARQHLASLSYLLLLGLLCGGARTVASTRAINASNSSSEEKCAAWPDTTCSTRPAQRPCAT